MSEVPTRLLRETLRAALTPGSSSGCIDAETLAAWADRTLSARERAAIESHASSCAACQALLAAAARLDVAAHPAPAPKRWQSSPLGWLVPIAAAAAAVAFWISVPEPRSSAPTSAAAERTVPAPPSVQPLAAPEDRRVEPTAQQRARSTAKREPPASASPAQPRLEEKAEVEARDSVAKVAPPPAPPPAAAPAAPARPDAASAQLAGRSALRVMAAAPAADKLIAASIEIASPERSIRWRIVTNNRVERSIDGGATWQPQSIDLTATINAGTAPSSSICWLVGRGGLVLLTTDGQTWRRIAFPEPLDLISVRASDAVTATAAAADGRAWTTADGGQTWRVAGRQP